MLTKYKCCPNPDVVSLVPDSTDMSVCLSCGEYMWTDSKRDGWHPVSRQEVKDYLDQFYIIDQEKGIIQDETNYEYKDVWK